MTAESVNEMTSGWRCYVTRSYVDASTSTNTELPEVHCEECST